MPMPEYFVFNDETKRNSHGFRLLNSGADLSRFNLNPVMLDTHEKKPVIGKWDNLRVEGSLMIAAPIFDVGDPEGLRLSGQVEREFVKAASPGIYIEDAMYMPLANGESELVVTKWELLECSILGVPSHANALAFYSKEGVQLSIDDALKSIQTLAAPTKPKEFINPKKNMEKIILTAAAATLLGLGTEHADMTAINAAVTALGARATEAETKLADFNKERATTLVDLAIAEGRLEANRKDSFVTLAISDFKQASDILGSLPAKKELGAKVKTGEQGVHTERADWDYMKWAKEDPKGLEELSAKQPE